MEDKMGLSKKLDEIFYLQPIFPGSNYDFPDFTNIDLDDIYESNEIYNFYKIKKNNGFISPRKLKIPSTIKEQSENPNRIDASSIWLPDLGELKDLED